MIKIAGDLYNRVLLNKKRLSDDLYTYKEVFDHTGDWPGDFVGRAILALVSLHRALDGFDVEQINIENQLKDIFDHINTRLNEDGYFGPKFDDTFVDEQQISGNSWFLRGLIEYYKLTKNDKYLKQINTICDKYLLKIAKYYDEYPITEREFGGVSGHTNQEIIGKWKVSTDIGCAFIGLDGMTAVYELNHNEDLKLVIEKVINKFLNLDYVNLECQTHATLSCCRGIFRFYQSTKDKKYLNYVIDIFNKYLSLGMTLDYSNINWFNRTDTWTEPCCIVDSMILSKKLYLELKDPKYLVLFNRIYINSIRTFQRNNGGAGCSTCAIGENTILKSFMYEAFFCCTMRLGEGLREIADFVAKVENDELTVFGPFDFEYFDENNSIIIHNDIYNHDYISIKTKNISTIKKVNLYVDGKLNTINLEPNNVITIKPQIDLKEINGIHYYSDIILTVKDELISENNFVINGKNYSFIYNNSQFDEETLSKKIQYVR